MTWTECSVDGCTTSTPNDECLDCHFRRATAEAREANSKVKGFAPFTSAEAKEMWEKTGRVS